MASNHLEDKQTIVTNLALTTAIDLKMFLEGKLPKWTEHRKHAKILIICGAHGDTLKVCLEDHELKFLINKEKKVGETKRYALDKTNYGKYIAKVGAKVLPIVGNVVVNLLM